MHYLPASCAILLFLVQTGVAQADPPGKGKKAAYVGKQAQKDQQAAFWRSKNLPDPVASSSYPSSGGSGGLSARLDDMFADRQPVAALPMITIALPRPSSPTKSYIKPPITAATSITSSPQPQPVVIKPPLAQKRPTQKGDEQKMQGARAKKERRIREDEYERQTEDTKAESLRPILPEPFQSTGPYHLQLASASPESSSTLPSSSDFPSATVSPEDFTPYVSSPRVITAADYGSDLVNADHEAELSNAAAEDAAYSGYSSGYNLRSKKGTASSSSSSSAAPRETNVSSMNHFMQQLYSDFPTTVAQEPAPSTYTFKCHETLFASDNNFISARLHYVSPQLPAPLDPTRIDVFIDNSNIWVALVKMRRNANTVNYERLITILERSRDVRKRFVAASLPLAQDFNTPLFRGYKVALLERTIKRQTGKYAEQAVDEILQLAIAKTLLGPRPLQTGPRPVIVLATGDGNRSVYDMEEEGFVTLMALATEQGYDVEVYAVRSAISEHWYEAAIKSRSDKETAARSKRVTGTLTVYPLDNFAEHLIDT